MAVVGAAGGVYAIPILPYALSFAAGARFFVVIEEVLPESIVNRNIGQAATGFLVGFLVMMVLDVALG
jgi:ZIP family zinc transporter